MGYNPSLPMYYGAQPKLFGFANVMRFAPTKAEKKMWEILNNHPYSTFKFRRQHPIATFIADFYSHRLRAVIEIDGSIHEKISQKEFDDFRDEQMQAFGISVLRLTNTEVLESTELAIEKINLHLANCSNKKGKAKPAFLRGGSPFRELEGLRNREPHRKQKEHSDTVG